MNGTVDFSHLFRCYCCWTVPAAPKKRVILMTETLTTTGTVSWCCAPLELLARDVFFFTWALQSQCRKLLVLHPPEYGELPSAACSRMSLPDNLGLPGTSTQQVYLERTQW